MILVTLGTQEQSFTRLLDYIEKSKIKEKIIVQSGHTEYKSKKMVFIPFMSYEEMSKLEDEANYIITHGGTGSVINPLKKNKIVIACSRKSEYGEHADNHQSELVNSFTKQGYILEISENNSLDDIMEKAKKFKPKKFISNNEKFVKNLKRVLD